MNDTPDGAQPETPMQRALRMKKAAAEARTKPSAGKLQPTAAGGMGAGQHKPWMKK